jgi:hypothetical protein
VDRMCGSIREFGFKIPVLARSDGEVVDGHLRLKAARKLGRLHTRCGPTTKPHWDHLTGRIYDTSESRRRGAAELRSSASSSPTLYPTKKIIAGSHPSRLSAVGL